MVMLIQMYLNPVLVFQVINNFRKVFNLQYIVNKLLILTFYFARMLPVKLHVLNLRTRFNYLMKKLVENKVSKQSTIYKKSKHNSGFVSRSFKVIPNHTFNSAEGMAHAVKHHVVLYLVDEEHAEEAYEMLESFVKSKKNRANKIEK
jgi:hypothetical protein